ncbi:hypothetical protein GPB2148_2575 [marine gamma proteobacterium HTCC2148]|jgi:hypothetical protein|nr:hypothetical protein GPB2148_2575 [marine gamma proteobacterium HTCC2148]
MMPFHFDHAVIFVPDLNKAIKKFSDLGFVVTQGGEHEYTCNALIIFDDRTFIEILALKTSWSRPLLKIAAKIGLINHLANNKPDVSWRLMRWITKQYGAIDWCIRVENMQAALDCFKSTKLTMLDTMTYQRRRPDGEIAQWLLGSAKDLDLPFLIQDKTLIDIRIPLGSHTQHPNGALGIKKIIIAPTDPVRTANAFNTFLIAAQSASYPTPQSIVIGATTVCMEHQPNARGKFSLELNYSGNDRKHLDTNKTCGANIWLTPNI